MNEIEAEQTQEVQPESADTEEITQGQEPGGGHEQPEQPEAPDYQAIAAEQGWKPYSEYDGDPAKWVPADEFVRRGPLLDEIKSRGREVKELRDSLDAMRTHNGKIMEALRNQQIGDLTAKRKEAIESGDAQGVEDLDRKIYETDQAYREQKPETPKTPPEIDTWRAENKWFDSDPDMQRFAVSYFGTLDQNDMAGSLEKTTEAVKRAFPDKFENPNRRRPAAVETSRKGGQTAKGLASLPREVQDVARKLIRSGVMTEAEYMKQYQEMNNA